MKQGKRYRILKCRSNYDRFKKPAIDQIVAGYYYA